MLFFLYNFKEGLSHFFDYFYQKNDNFTKLLGHDPVKELGDQLDQNRVKDDGRNDAGDEHFNQDGWLVGTPAVS